MDFVKTLLKGPLQVTFVVLGAIFVLLGSATFDKLPMIGAFRATNPTVLRSLGFFLVVVGILIALERTLRLHLELRQRRLTSASRTARLPKAAEFEIRIVSHSDNEEVTGNGPHKFRGTIKRELPDHYALWLVRRWKTEPNKYYPEGKAHLKPVAGSATEYTWEVDDVFVGGNLGDRRIIEMWLVGPDGQILLEAVENAYKQHAELMKVAGQEWDKKWLQRPLTKSTTDMVLGPHITVVRR